jgi:hypothetical protein
MKKIILLFGLVIASACSFPRLTLVTAQPKANITETPASASCYFVWATKDLPEVSGKFMAELKKIIPKAEGRAYAYGEDCIFADGHAQFSAMETDFSLTIPVKDLKDDEALGKQIELLLPVLDQLPKDTLPARIGRIEIQFTSSGENRFVRFQHEAAKKAFEQGLRGADLLNSLDSSQ